MPSKLPSYTRDKLALVGKMTSQIAAAAARYGVPAEAIAGGRIRELWYDQINSSSWSRYTSVASRPDNRPWGLRGA